MKRIVLLLSFIVAIGVNNTNAQKPGILKIDNYGDFTGDDWVDFLGGKRVLDFEKKSTIKLADYRVMVESFVKTELKEASIASAIDNSTVKPIPAGTKVYTCRNDGTWITRDAYAGEKGFNHTPTGKNWLSFSCGNLTDVPIGAPTPKLEPKKEEPGSMTQILLAANSKKEDMSALEFYLAYSKGQQDYSTIQNNTMGLFKQMKDMGCGGCGTSSSAMIVREVAAPAPVMYAAPAAQSVSQQYITTRYKPNAVDWINTAANVSNAVNRWFPQKLNVNVNGVVGIIGSIGGNGQQYAPGPYSSGIDLGNQAQLGSNGTFVDPSVAVAAANGVHSNGW